MAGKGTLGDFGFPATFAITETAANTLTFEQLQTGLSVADRIGWIIQRIETTLGVATPGYFNGTTDTLNWGLAQNSSLSTVTLDNPNIKYLRKLCRTDFGTAASASIDNITYVDDYTGLAGGGILVVPQPLYGFVQGGGLSAAASINMKIWVKAINLTDADYFNLVQNTQLILSQ